MKRAIVFLILFLLLVDVVAGDSSVDNNLQPLFSAKKAKWNVRLAGMYPEPSVGPPEYDYISISESHSRATIEFNVNKPANITRAYLYIFTGGYDCDCEKWDVKFNNRYLAVDTHSRSVGPNPDGDGEYPQPGRQTIRFEVDGSDIVNGSNTIEIRGTGFFYRDQYYIRGVVLVMFYEAPQQHELWVYDGVEYLNHKLAVSDYFYALDFNGSTYPSDSEATLYVVYHNQEIPEDALYFNNHFLNDSDATYLFGTINSSYLLVKRFDVGSYLDRHDTLNFTYQYYTPVGEPPRMYTGDYPLYPSLVILDVVYSDTTPPSILFSSPLNGTEVEVNRSVDINFTVDDPEASVSLLLDGSEVQASQKPGGEWSYEWSLVDLALGIHNITAYATDASGNTGYDTVLIEVVKPAPEVRILSPENGSVHTLGSNISIQLSVSDPEAAVSIEIDGNLVSNSTTYLWNTSSFETGLHRISAHAVNELGKEGVDEVTVNLTLAEHGTTTTTTSTTTTTTTTTTTLPPQTAPPSTPQPVPEVELALNSLTLSTRSDTVRASEDFTVFAFASNAAGSSVEATIALYSDDDLLEAKTITLGSYEAREVEFNVRAGRLAEGPHTLKAKIVVQGVAVRELDPSNNEKARDIIVAGEKGFLDILKPYLTYLIALLVLLVVARLAITFIFQGEEDYLR